MTRVAEDESDDCRTVLVLSDSPSASSSTGSNSQYLSRELCKFENRYGSLVEGRLHTWNNSMSLAISLVLICPVFVAAHSLKRFSTANRSCYSFTPTDSEKKIEGKEKETHLEAPRLLLEIFIPFYVCSNVPEIHLHLCTEAHIQTRKIRKSWDTKIEVQDLVFLVS